MVDAFEGSDIATTRGEERRPQSYELGATRCQTTGTSKENLDTAYQTGHEGGRVTVNMALDRMEWRRGTWPTPCR